MEQAGRNLNLHHILSSQGSLKPNLKLHPAEELQTQQTLLPLNECRELFLSLGIYKSVLWLHFEYAHCMAGVNSADLCRGAAPSPSKLKMRMKLRRPYVSAWSPRQLLASQHTKRKSTRGRRIPQIAQVFPTPSLVCRIAGMGEHKKALSNTFGCRRSSLGFATVLRAFENIFMI